MAGVYQRVLHIFFQQCSLNVPQCSNSVVDHIFDKVNLRQLKARDVLALGSLLLKQERDFGVNMFSSIDVDDEASYKMALASGTPHEQAVLEIFNRKVASGALRWQDQHGHEMDHAIPAVEPPGSMEICHGYQIDETASVFPTSEFCLHQQIGQSTSPPNGFGRFLHADQPTMSSVQRSFPREPISFSGYFSSQIV